MKQTATCAVALAASIASLAGCSSAPTPADEDVVVFRDVRLLDFSGKAPTVREHVTVVVRGGEIEAVSEGPLYAVPPSATVIEGRGRTLLPGLVDMHVHIWDQAELPAYLSYGVTSVRNLSGMPHVLAMRDAIDAGELVGPRITTTGPILNGPGPNAQLNHQIVADAEEARVAVRAQYAAGYRRLKVYSNLSRASYEAIRVEAKALGMTIAGHTPEGVRDDGIPFDKPFNIRFDELLNDDFVTFEHTESIVWHGLREDFDEDKARQLARRIAASGVTVDPTLIAHANLLRVAESSGAWLERPGVETLNPFISQMEQENFDRWSNADPDYTRKAAAFYARVTKIFAEEGVRLVTGTDAGIFTNIPGASLMDEFALMEDAGLTSFEILQAATYNAALTLGEEDAGRIAPGYRADMVLATGDPLTDLGVLNAPAGVMRNGEWFDAQAVADLRTRAADTDFERSQTNVLAAMAAQSGP